MATASTNDFIDALMRANLFSEELIEESRRVRRLAFCGSSSSLFSSLFQGKISNADAPRAQALADLCETFDPSLIESAAQWIQSCSLVEKPSKLGATMALARALFKGSFPEFAACALDARLLSIGSRSRDAGPQPWTPDQRQCLSMLAKASAGACKPLRASCCSRCCYEPMPGPLELLLDFQFPPDGPCIHGHEPLLLACAQFYARRPGFAADTLACAAHLAAHGADIEKPDAMGRKPLSCAAENRQWDLCKLLLSSGADPFCDPGGDGSSAPIHIFLATPEMADIALAAREARALRESLPCPASPASRKPAL